MRTIGPCLADFRSVAMSTAYEMKLYQARSAMRAFQRFFMPSFVGFCILTACSSQIPPHNSQGLEARQLRFSHGSPQDLKEAWDRYNEPNLVDVPVKRFDLIHPRAAIQNKTIWSGYYWPTYIAGISYRWQHGSDIASYKYDLLNASQVENLSPAQTNRLSPAEKYDLLLDNFNFSLTKAEKQRYDAAAALHEESIPVWFGLCHGWAAAAIMEAAPKRSVTVTSRQGRPIRFESADIKALITKAYSDLSLYQTTVVGRRCRSETLDRDHRNRVIASNCRDLNPGSFHLIVTDYIARRNQPLIVDFSQTHAVWNYPIQAYQFTYNSYRAMTSRDPMADVRAPGTAFLVDVNMRLTQVSGSFPNTSQNFQAQITLSYTLELDRNHNIIGGEWMSQNTPDFLWTVDSTPETNNSYVNYQLIKWLTDKSAGLITSQSPWEGPEAPDDQLPPDESASDVEDANDEPTPDTNHMLSRFTPGSREQAFLLNIVNKKFADFLIYEVGLSRDAAYKIRIRVIGRDGYSPSRDDQYFRSLAELQRYIPHHEILKLARYTLRRM